MEQPNDLIEEYKKFITQQNDTILNLKNENERLKKILFNINGFAVDVQEIFNLVQEIMGFENGIPDLGKMNKFQIGQMMATAFFKVDMLKIERELGPLFQKVQDRYKTVSDGFVQLENKEKVLLNEPKKNKENG